MNRQAKKAASSGRPLSRMLLYVCLFLILIFMLLFPQTAASGALTGLMLWSKTLLPILLPFLILSNLFITLQMTKPFEKLLAPIFTKLFPLSSACCYPLFLGLLCGMPLGAKTTADLLRLHRISGKEAMFLICFSNQASMMFLISYVATKELSTPHCAVFVLLILYSCAFLSTIFVRNAKYNLETPAKVQNNTLQKVPSFFAALDSCIPESFATITKVGGYVILFSMLSAFLSTLPLPDTLTAVLSGILEITSGIECIAHTSLPAVKKTALTLGVTAFGGLSGLMQTKSVTLSTGLSMRTYVFVKFVQGVLAYLFTLILFPLFFHLR